MQRLLIIGCGDVVQRALPWLLQRFRVYALVRNPAQAAALRAQGVVPVCGDLDQPRSLRRLAGLADWLLHSAPPAPSGTGDVRTTRLLAALAGASVPRCIVYISTSGVYGDHQGACIDESAPLRTASPRALRRVAAESQLRRFARRHACRVSLLRAPGIYAADRLPIDRIRSGTPAIVAAEDSYSNHIHADDLARACGLALFRGRGGRAYNICDDAHWTMGEWFDRVADACQLPRPPRLPRADVARQVSPMLWSFLCESRRLGNQRMHRELRVRLSCPTPDTLLHALPTAD